MQNRRKVATAAETFAYKYDTRVMDVEPPHRGDGPPTPDSPPQNERRRNTEPHSWHQASGLLEIPFFTCVYQLPSSRRYHRDTLPYQRGAFGCRTHWLSQGRETLSRRRVFSLAGLWHRRRRRERHSLASDGCFPPPPAAAGAPPRSVTARGGRPAETECDPAGSEPANRELK